MLIDITQELFSCNVFPGDPMPEKRRPMSIENGDICNLTELTMCAHNGTHVDAPFHFIKDGKTIDQVPLDSFVGECFVARHEGDVSAADAERILSKAKMAQATRLLSMDFDSITKKDVATVCAEDIEEMPLSHKPEKRKIGF